MSQPDQVVRIILSSGAVFTAIGGPDLIAASLTTQSEVVCEGEEGKPELVLRVLHNGVALVYEEAVATVRE
jgi:hypothetical protein